jgi:hypothetical protein
MKDMKAADDDEEFSPKRSSPNVKEEQTKLHRMYTM